LKGVIGDYKKDEDAQTKQQDARAKKS